MNEKFDYEEAAKTAVSLLADAIDERKALEEKLESLGENYEAARSQVEGYQDMCQSNDKGFNRVVAELAALREKHGDLEEQKTAHLQIIEELNDEISALEEGEF